MLFVAKLTGNLAAQSKGEFHLIAQQHATTGTALVSACNGDHNAGMKRDQPRWKPSGLMQIYWQRRYPMIGRRQGQSERNFIVELTIEAGAAIAATTTAAAAT